MSGTFRGRRTFVFGGARESYDIEELPDGETRELLRLQPQLAPVKVAVLPLVNKLKDRALSVFEELRQEFNCEFDTSGAIGKRYRRQDAIGTPFCVTIDYDTLDDYAVTVRERDTMEQERIKISDLKAYINERIKG